MAVIKIDDETEVLTGNDVMKEEQSHDQNNEKCSYGDYSANLRPFFEGMENLNRMLGGILK